MTQREHEHEPETEPVTPPEPEEPDVPGEPEEPEGDEAELSADELRVRGGLTKAFRAVVEAGSVVMEGRYKSIAITHLESAELFYRKAIEVDGVK